VALEAPKVRPRTPGPGLCRKKGAVAERAGEVLTAGGSVWFGDETTLREFPPLRAAWAPVGEQAEVVISGRNARRGVHGMVNIVTGELVRVIRPRGRGDDVAAAVAVLAEHTGPGPTLLVWDNAPPHHTRVARQAAADADIELAWLPFRSPELNPCEDIWRRLKATVAANRAYPSVDDLAERASAWFASRSPDDFLRYAGLSSSKFAWLLT
jgi:transposase